jgi:hypothetical protein
MSARIPVTTQEATLITNLFEGSSPFLLPVGSGQLLLWEQQDPTLPVLQSTDIAWSLRNGSTWSDPALIAHDTRAELSPVAGVDQNGRVVAAWLRIKDAAFSTPINTTGDLPLFYTRLEVVSAVFDPATRAWGPITQLTGDTAMDSALRLSSDGAGHLMLTWLANPQGQFMSTTQSPSVLKYAVWDGSSWGTPGVVASGLVGVSSQATALRGSRALIVVGRLPNGDPSAQGELDLYTWNGVLWNGPATFADDGVDNRVPSAVFDSSGQGHVVWLHGDDLVHASVSDPTPRVIRRGSRSLAFYGAKLLASRQGNMALVWEEAADNGPANLFGLLFDPASGGWSADRRLNEDTLEAHDFQGYFGEDGVLHAVYLATNIERTSETVTIGGSSVVIPNIPQNGRTDLRILEHSLVVDLAVTNQDLRIDPIRPQAGTTVTVHLEVHNAGDFTVGAFAVDVYVGSPESGGALFGRQTVAGPLLAGAERDVTFSLSYPAGGGDIVAIVDPNNALSEFTMANNRASVSLTNHAPLAKVMANVTAGNAPLAVTFDAAGSSDQDGDPISYSWVFGDGTANGAGTKASHTFSTPGSYPVMLVATDSYGNIGTAVVTITVGRVNRVRPRLSGSGWRP